MIAFCITCKGRVQHVEQTLPKNLASNEDGIFVLLDYGSQDNLVEYLKNNHQDAIDQKRLVIYSFPQANRFQMAHAKNMAHRCAIREGADILCNLDADNYTGYCFAKYIKSQIKSKDDKFLWAKMVKDGEGRLPRGISGRIVVTANTFLKVGGYDEVYSTWSPDDKDLQYRLRRMNYEAQEIPSKYLFAIMHNDKMRFREYPEVHNLMANGEEEFRAVENLNTTVANFGKIGCGTVYRNFDFGNPISLEPLPTRIFGIGMHKTATTSLHKALEILGYNSAHWPDAHWAKAVWTEMATLGRSPAVEKYYAVCDLPTTILYEQLDKAYPGSKFILTIRPDGDWLRSVQDHWDHEKNPFRKDWSNDPFTHKVHKLVYGQKGFDSELFLRRYRKHNADVKEYFKNRPNDLLLLERHNWPDLCAFLKRGIPNQSYPKAFATVRKD